MDTVTVGSRCLLPIRLDDAGTTLNGSAHPQAVAGVGITRNVDKKAFEAFMEKNARMDAVARGLIFELPEEAEKVQPPYGFQAGLEASEKDEENTKAAAEGSTVKDPIGLQQGVIATGEPSNIPAPTMVEVAQTLGAPNTPAPKGPADNLPPPPPPVAVKVEAPEPPAAPKPAEPVMPDDPSSKPLA